jgi:hypothetical protein
MQAGEQQPLLAEVGVIGEGTLTLLPPAAHEEEAEVEGVETLLGEIATLTVTEIRRDVHPQDAIHHLTEEAVGVAGVANGRRHRVRDQGVHRDAEDLATIDIVYLYIHCSSSYRLQTCCSARQNHVVQDVQILTMTLDQLFNRLYVHAFNCSWRISYSFTTLRPKLVGCLAQVSHQFYFNIVSSPCPRSNPEGPISDLRWCFWFQASGIPSNSCLYIITYQRHRHQYGRWTLEA